MAVRLHGYVGQLRFGHLVERIEERDGGVEVVSRAGGEIAAERFDRVVIAAGGLNSPLLLQRSGLGGTQVGQNFTDHPMGFVAKLEAARPSDVFTRLRRNTGLYARSESMLKIRDRETGLWSAFYHGTLVGILSSCWHQFGARIGSLCSLLQAPYRDGAYQTISGCSAESAASRFSLAGA